MDAEILKLIKKQCRGKQHIKLTVGYLSNNSATIRVFDGNGETDNEDYVYEIASITKTFTASLLAKYLHEGKISLDDSIGTYILGLEQNRYYPTIKRLITHTSGYARRLPMSRTTLLKVVPKAVFSGVTNELLVSLLYMDEQKMKAILNNTILSDKDYRWQYSNFGIALVGYAIGVISGKGYSATMDEFLANELGLPNSCSGTFSGKNLPGFNKKDAVGGNVEWGENLLRPAGDISSTAKDLLRYAEINFNDELPYLSVCHQKYAKSNFLYSRLFDVDMGLGWLIGKKENLLLHGGDTAVFSSVLIVDKKHKAATVVLSNYPGNSYNLLGIAIPLLQRINRDYNG
jgi:CubicO group peptidase (beta-lactamase class C family)